MRADVDVDTLLKVILVLIVIVLALRVVDRSVSTVYNILGPASDLLGILVLLLIVLYLLDRL